MKNVKTKLKLGILQIIGNAAKCDKILRIIVYDEIY